MAVMLFFHAGRLCARKCAIIEQKRPFAKGLDNRITSSFSIRANVYEIPDMLVLIESALQLTSHHSGVENCTELEVLKTALVLF